MFEIIKCYRKLRRAELWMRGSIRVGEILHDDMLIKDSEKTIQLIANMKKKIWFNRKLAKEYNSEFERQGFK